MHSDRDRIRAEIDRHLAEARWADARAAIEHLWYGHASAALAGYVSGCCERLRPHLPSHACRVAVLRSYTLEPVLPLLRATAWINRIDVAVKAGGFNAYAQELLDSASWLYAAEQDAVILAVQTQDVAPVLWEGFADCTAAEVHATVERVLEDFRSWIRAFRSRSRACLVIHGLEAPTIASRGILDGQSAYGQVEAIREVNRGLVRTAAEFRGVHVLDYDALVSAHGKARWRDEQRWATVKLPMRPEGVAALAAEWVRYLCPIAGRTAKVLAVDLDNTIWGGVAGEDGVDGLACSMEYPGIAWRNVQRALLDLKQRGILLAICSKNHREDAAAVFGAHPGMLLTMADFASERINWQDKPSNLREIAAELNVGLESIAFVDDSAAERERVRRELPEVAVLELPADPMGLAPAIRLCPMFERLALSEEDTQRNRYYSEQHERATALGGAASVEDFYRSLAQEVEIAPVDSRSLTRAAQLTQKTNQFNLTARRFTEQQLADFAKAPGCEAYTVRVRDRFGDNGLVGVMLTRTEDGACHVDTFLLSCRVISRTVETAMLSFLTSEARDRGLAVLEGYFLPTARNGPAADLFRRHGFELCGSAESGTRWKLDLAGPGVACPEWIHLSVTKGSIPDEYAVSTTRP
jgi:FkbH-like protein